jgi:hypothetical protein
VTKQGSHSLHTERFNLKKLNEAEGTEQYCVEVSNRFAALEDLDTQVEINSAWETIRENIKISAKESLGYFELKKHKPWFDEGCSKLLDVNLLGDNIDTIRKNAETLIDASKEVGLEINVERTQSICCSLVTRMQVKIGT